MELLTGPDKGKQGYINYIVQVMMFGTDQNCFILINVVLGKKLGYG